MNIPNLLHSPIGYIETTTKIGGKQKQPVYLSEEWAYFFGQLIQQMQSNLSNEGFVIPQQKTDDITTISVNVPNGTQIYNLQTHEPLVKVNGVMKVIQTV
jgi:hypothetical protein